MATRIDQVGYNNREEIIEEIQLRLADGMVDVELDRDHYDIAINKAIQKYRQLSSCLLYTSPSPRDQRGSRMPSSA